MRPTVLSEKRQEFDGKSYYLCGMYFQKNGKRLHRTVWEQANGPIPKGAHIHHKDGNRANNNLENLGCLGYKDHLGGEHGEASGERGRHALEDAQTKAAVWHGSAEGKKWHSDHYEKCIREVMARRVPATCGMCGKEYMVAQSKAKQGKWCGGTCKARALRQRRKVGEG